MWSFPYVFTDCYSLFLLLFFPLCVCVRACVLACVCVCEVVVFQDWLHSPLESAWVFFPFLSMYGPTVPLFCFLFVCCCCWNGIYRLVRFIRVFKNLKLIIDMAVWLTDWLRFRADEWLEIHQLISDLQTSTSVRPAPVRTEGRVRMGSTGTPARAQLVLPAATVKPVQLDGHSCT